MHETQSACLIESQATFLITGWRLAGPEKLPFGRPGERPQGFGGSAGVPKPASSDQNPRSTLTGVRRVGWY